MMHKLLIITLSVLLTLLLTITAAFLFLFSPSGNNALQPYVKEEIEEALQLPVEIQKFELEAGTSKLNILVNKQLSMQIITHYSMWDKSIKGIYQLKAKDFEYENIQLRQANIKGNFSGVAEDMLVDGKGTALDSNVVYSLRVVDNMPQKIIATMKNVAFAEILQLAGQPALVEGQVDIDIDMPNIGEETAKGYGHIVLTNGVFNEKLVRKLYNFTLPKKSYVNAQIDATLNGQVVKIKADTKSNLFTNQVKNASYNLATKELKADYAIDVKEVRLLSQNKLAGALKLDGHVEVKDKEMHLTGESQSFGGILRLDVGKTSKIHFENVALEKLLYFAQQKPEAEGLMNGGLVITDKEKKTGTYDIRMNALKIAKATQKHTIGAKGKFELANTVKVSGTMTGLGEKLSFKYDSKEARLDAQGLFIEKLLSLAGLPIAAKGTVSSKIELSNSNNVEGTFIVKSTNLVTDAKIMKKLTGEALQLKINVSSEGTIKKDQVKADTKVKTSMGTLSLNGTIFDSKNSSLKSAYRLDIPDLKKTHALINKKFYGSMVFQGELSKNEVLNLTGNTKSLGGKIDYMLVGDNVNANISAVPLESILGFLGHKKVFLGKALGTAKYNLKQKTGVVDLNIASFQIKPTTWTSTITMFLGKDPSRIIFSDTKFHAVITGDIVDYTLNAKGTKSSIEINNGKLNKATNNHTAEFQFVYEKHTIRGAIKGTLENPKVTLDTSSLINDEMKDKLQNKVEKMFGEKAGNFMKGLSF